MSAKNAQVLFALALAALPGALAQPAPDVQGGGSDLVTLALSPGDGVGVSDTGFLVYAGGPSTLNVDVSSRLPAREDARLLASADAGATVDPANTLVTMDPTAPLRVPLTLRAPEVGRVNFMAQIDGPHATGNGAQLLALPPLSFRFLAEGGAAREDAPGRSFIVIASGTTFTPRVSVTNFGANETPAIPLSLDSPAGDYRARATLPALAKGESAIVAFDAWTPPVSPGGPNAGAVALNARLTFRMGGESLPGTVAIASGGAPTPAPVEVVIQSVASVVVRALPPVNARLGVATNASLVVLNGGTEAFAAMPFTITLSPPGGIDYGVQKPERVDVDVPNLAPGASVSRFVPFTPLVAGAWSVTVSALDTSTHRYYGDQASFTIETPLRMVSLDPSVAYPGMSQPVKASISLASSRALANASLVVWTGEPFGRGEGSIGALVGIARRIVVATPERVAIGALAAGHTVDATVTVVASGSGTYLVVPFVRSGPFAYSVAGAEVGSPGGPRTALPPGVVDVPGGGGETLANALTLHVQPRHVPTLVAFVPLALVVAVVVASWRLRTRWVR